MPAPILHLGATVLCSHAGQATPVTPFPRVTVSGQPIATLTTPYAIAGCALSGTSTPPCITGQWTSGATRVVAGGVPVVTVTGSSVCVPTGSPMVPVVARTRVMAT